jgi:transcriptional regulator with XRE-family HTH domain
MRRKEFGLGPGTRAALRKRNDATPRALRDWHWRGRERMLGLNISPVALADKTGVTEATIRAYFTRGDTIAQPRPGMLEAIAAALHTTERWLLFGDASPDPEPTNRLPVVTLAQAWSLERHERA